MRRAHWLIALALSLVPNVSHAIQLHWSSGADTLTFSEATRAILVLRADSAEVTLPPEWRLLWVADSTEVQVVALDSLEVCAGDTAQVYGVDGPSTPEDSTAHRVTAHFCSGESGMAEQAVFQLDLPAWGRGKCKVVALDPADSSIILESNEVTFNGGVGSPYPPEPTRGTDSSRRPRIDRVTPTSAQANVAVTLLVEGANFAPGVQLELQQGRATWPAASVELRDPSALSARIKVPNVPGTALDVLVRLGSGAEARLPQGLVVTNAPGDASTTRKFIRPTNADIAHRQIHLFSDRSYQNIYDHVQSPEPPYSGWPSSLDDPTYLAVRQTQHGPDSIAIINSAANDGVCIEATTCPSWVTYYLNPPQYATSLALLTSSSHVFDGPHPEFQDRGKGVLRVKPTFEDGSSSYWNFAAGEQIRSWRTATLDCEDGGVIKEGAYLTSAPTDTIATELWTNGTRYYDIQRIRFPAEKESLKVTGVELQGLQVAHPCNWYGRAGVFGLAVWPDFVIQDQHGHGVQGLSQLNPAWRYHPYGGYTYGNYGPIGTRRTIGWSGCSITSIAMGFSFYGHSCTPDDINTYLQTNSGYEQKDVAEIVSAVGDTVLFKGHAFTSKDWAPSPTFPNMHDEFLVERKVDGSALHHPVATIEIVRKTNKYGVGHVVQTYPGYGTVEVGDLGYYYFNRIVDVVNDFASDRVTVNYMPKDSRRAARVESLLVRSRLLTATTHNKSSGLHWVVFDGWQPAFISADTARGTYHLADPAYGNTRLIQRPFVNEFSETMYFMDNTAHLSLDAAAGPESGGAGSGGLSISIGGHSVVQVVDPLGRVTSLDPGTGEYVSEVPLILTLRGWTDDDEADDPADVSDGVDVFEIPGAVDGQYLVTAAGSDVSLSANGYDASGVLGADHVVDTTASGGGCVYGVTYTAVTGRVQVLKLGVAAVAKDHGWSGRTDFRVLGNPGREVVRLAVTLGSQEVVRVAIYDVSGRVVGEVPGEELPPGEHVLSWTAGGRNIKPGVYFAVLDAGGQSRVAKFVLLQ